MSKVQEEAENWYARILAPDCRSDDRKAFKAWLERHPENARAYAAIERLARYLSDQAASNARLRAMAEQAMAETARPENPPKRPGLPAARLLPAPMALAASVLLCAFLTLQISDFMDSSEQAIVLNTSMGERRDITLEDGTLTQLDIDSSLTVNMSAEARDVTLIKGRAIFDVAHDAQRPFSVAVGEGRIKALGTRFQVQSIKQTIIVTLEEGSVDVTNAVHGGQLTRRMRPGEQLQFTQGVEGWINSTIETDVATSWAKGRHVFRSTGLVDALEEINRYSVPKVRLGDSSLADLVVSGNFIVGDSRSIVSAFAEAFSVRVVETGNELLLFPYYSHANHQQPDYVR